MANPLVSPDYDVFGSTGVYVLDSNFIKVKNVVASPQESSNFVPPTTMFDIVCLNEPDIYSVIL